MQINAINGMGMPIIYFKGSQVKRPTYVVLQSPMIVFILENSADPDEMPHSVAFHLVLHCVFFFYQSNHLVVSSIQKV